MKVNFILQNVNMDCIELVIVIGRHGSDLTITNGDDDIMQAFHNAEKFSIKYPQK